MAGGKGVTVSPGDQGATTAGFTEAGIGATLPLDVGLFGGESPPSGHEKAGAIVGCRKEDATLLGDAATTRAGGTKATMGDELLAVDKVKPPTWDTEATGAFVGRGK